MNFIKTFLAAILAFVVGSVLVVFLWIFILLGIAGSMEKSVAVHPESILKLGGVDRCPVERSFRRLRFRDAPVHAYASADEGTACA